eukprot:1147280-Pelagomonas_calceolata.AAC.8
MLKSGKPFGKPGCRTSKECTKECATAQICKQHCIHAYMLLNPHDPPACMHLSTLHWIYTIQHSVKNDEREIASAYSRQTSTGSMLANQFCINNPGFILIKGRPIVAIGLNHPSVRDNFLCHEDANALLLAIAVAGQHHLLACDLQQALDLQALYLYLCPVKLVPSEQGQGNVQPYPQLKQWIPQGMEPHPLPTYLSRVNHPSLASIRGIASRQSNAAVMRLFVSYPTSASASTSFPHTQ